MDTKHFKKKLEAMEKDLTGRVQQHSRLGREQVNDTPGDAGDASVVDVAASDHFTTAQVDGVTLDQVQDALRRIDAGTFGQCVIDNGPIEKNRLEAVPWTPYCLEHQSALEDSSDQRNFTM